jgi:hypothetical protein
VAKTKSSTVTVDRRRTKERRAAAERRTKKDPLKSEQRKLERRKKVNRRRQIDPTTCERDYSIEEVEFMQALDEYKRSSGRMFPTCSEILEVIHKLGYVKQSAAVTTEAGALASAEEDNQPVAPPEAAALSETEKAAAD